MRPRIRVLTRSWFIAGAIAATVLLGTAPAGRAADSTPFFGTEDVERYCEGLGGSFSSSEFGWVCTLPNGDQLWCDHVHRVCGYVDRGKPAPKRDRKQHVAIAQRHARLAARSPGATEAGAEARLVRNLPALAKAASGNNTNSLEATCGKVDELIAGYEDLLDGDALLGAAVDVVPGLRDRLQGGLNDAKEFKANVCDPVLG